MSKLRRPPKKKRKVIELRKGEKLEFEIERAPPLAIFPSKSGKTTRHRTGTKESAVHTQKAQTEQAEKTNELISDIEKLSKFQGR